MPDRSKRRKNNKNKKKNKNNNWLSSKSSDIKSSSNENVSGAVSASENDNSEISIVSENGTSDFRELSQSSSKSCEYSDSANININNDTTSEIHCSDLIPIDQSSVQKLGIDSSECKTENTTKVIEPLDSGETSHINHNELPGYVVESPQNSLKHKTKPSNVKSKSLDDDEVPKIIEITDECKQGPGANSDRNCVLESCNAIVSDAESTDWETTIALRDNCAESADNGKLGVISIPLNVALCDEIKSITAEEESNLRNYLNSLNLSTKPSSSAIEIKTEIEEIINREVRHRLSKKSSNDDFGFIPRLPAPPRFLDVIDEEGSGESSASSRRQSQLIEKKSDELSKDNFEDLKLNKNSNVYQKDRFAGRQIPQQCLLLDAKLKGPDVSEARGDWSVHTIEQVAGAEVVYLSDTSSSTSSLYEVAEETEGSETDVSVRMITPTIEVTDTENLLKKNYLKTNSLEKEDNLPDKPQIKNQHPTNPHEIVVLSTDDIKTSLYVKDIEENNIGNKDNKPSVPSKNTDYDLEIKMLKCELNDVFNNLINEVSSDSEGANDNTKNYVRQDSASSVGSQCTAKYIPTHSSLNDVANCLHDEIPAVNEPRTNTQPESVSRISSHVKEVFDRVSGSTSVQNTKPTKIDLKQPLHLKDLCVSKIACLPYGESILQELAAVSEKLQSITLVGSKNCNTPLVRVNSAFEQFKSAKSQGVAKMPYYPLPDISAIEKVALPTKDKDAPPPVSPRNSSLYKTHEESFWTGLPTDHEPVYVCLSPSQKMLMEKTNTVITKEDASELLDMHRKYVDRRGYSEHRNATSDNPPAVPFKSQSGSRLLAIIRDPSANNIHSQISKSQNKSLDRLQTTSNKYKKTNNFYEQSLSAKDLSSNTFKPIPPPRPRKFSSSFYESDETDFSDNSLRSIKSEKKYFHYSTGTLNKEIENDISSIQQMHRRYTNFRDISQQDAPRRPSLPKDICEQQMEYIRKKEKEVEAEIKRLEEKRNVQERKGPRAPLLPECEKVEEQFSGFTNYTCSRKETSCNNNKDENKKHTSNFSSSQEEIQREKMYSEYMCQMAQRQERKEQKVIKISNKPVNVESRNLYKSLSAANVLDSKVNNPLEKEFIVKARQRLDKLGIKDPETEDEKEDKDVYTEPNRSVEQKIKVIEGGEVRDVQKLPSHLQEFVRLTAKDKKNGTESPGESNVGSSNPHVIVCAVLILVYAIARQLLQYWRNMRTN